MSTEAVNLWLVILTGIQLLGGGIVVWVIWTFKRAFVPRAEYEEFVNQMPKNVGDRIEGIRERGARQDERLTVLEHQMTAVPSRGEVKELEVSIANLQGTITGLDTRLDGLNSLVERVENHAKTIDNYLRERQGGPAR